MALWHDSLGRDLASWVCQIMHVLPRPAGWAPGRALVTLSSQPAMAQALLGIMCGHAKPIGSTLVQLHMTLLS